MLMVGWGRPLKGVVRVDGSEAFPSKFEIVGRRSSQSSKPLAPMTKIVWCALYMSHRLDAYEKGSQGD